MRERLVLLIGHRSILAAPGDVPVEGDDLAYERAAAEPGEADCESGCHVRDEVDVQGGTGS